MLVQKRLVRKRLLLLISSRLQNAKLEEGKQTLTRVLARPWLMTLYVIFPIHLNLNFPIRSRCDFKAIIQRRKQWIVLRLLEVFSFSKRHFLWYCTCMWYLINFSILSRFVPIFHVFLSIMYLLFSQYHVLFTRFFLNICKGFSLQQFSPDILNVSKNFFFN